jgi:hypothetical protein
MALEAALDILYRAVDVLVTEPGDLDARLEQAGIKVLSLNLLTQYEGFPAPFKRNYEELKKGLNAGGDIPHTISTAKDDEKKQLAFKIVDLYCSALRRS